jgi:hypothetical protein
MKSYFRSNLDLPFKIQRSRSFLSYSVNGNRGGTRGGTMANGEGSRVHHTVPYSSMCSSLCNRDGTRDPFYSLAAVRSVHRGPAMTVWLGRASMATRSSPGGSPVPRACAEASLSPLLASQPTNFSNWQRKPQIWWRLGFSRFRDLQPEISAKRCAIYRAL